jgi:hypothetical protein
LIEIASLALKKVIRFRVGIDGLALAAFLAQTEVFCPMNKLTVVSSPLRLLFKDFSWLWLF